MTEQAVTAGPGTLFILAVCIALLIMMIVRFKIHPFFTLVAVAIFGGLAFGLGPDTTISTVISGFGSTIGSIGIVIVLGCTIGEILERTGGAVAIAESMLRAVGKTRSTIAMAMSGYLVSVPVFSDSAFVIMAPVARALSFQSGLPLVALVGALNSGILATHSMVPPTPGPIAAAGVLNADLGMVIIIGAIAAIPYTIAGYFWTNSKYIKNRYPHVSELKAGERRVQMDDVSEGIAEQSATAEAGPSRFLSFMPIIVPVILICISSFSKMLLPEDAGILTFLNFIGHPIIALTIGLLIALFLDTTNLNMKTIEEWFSAGVDKSGFIIIATGAAGAFGAILRASNVGPYLGELIASTGIPAVFIPWAIAAVVMIAQGSATVSLLTAAAITAPMLGTLGLHPAIATIAVGAGATFATHANCSHFWVVTKMSDDMSLEQGYRVVTVHTILGSIAAILTVWILSLFITP